MLAAGPGDRSTGADRVLEASVLRSCTLLRSWMEMADSGWCCLRCAVGDGGPGAGGGAGAALALSGSGGGGGAAGQPLGLGTSRAPDLQARPTWSSFINCVRRQWQRARAPTTMAYVGSKGGPKVGIREKKAHLLVLLG